MKTNVINLYQLIADKLCILSEVLSSIGILICFTLMLTQVILRYLFNSGLSWGEEVTRYTMVWVAMLSGGILIKNRELLKVDFLDAIWSPSFIKYRDLLSHMLFCCTFIVIIVEGWNQAFNALTARSRMISINVNFFWAYLAMPVGAVIMVVQLILSFILQNLKKR